MSYSSISKISSLILFLGFSILTIQSCTQDNANDDLILEQRQVESLLETSNTNALIKDHDLVDPIAGVDRGRNGGACRCRAWLSDISPSLSSFPETSYYAALVSFADQNGTVFDGEILSYDQRSAVFYISDFLLPVSVALEGNYDGGPTFPAGSFKINLRCNGGEFPSSSLALTMQIDEGQEDLILTRTGSLDEDCDIIQLSND